MGRKPIPPNQRAQVISFSLKPHLIEKIDNFASDMRFSRSKFLMQAVTEYMTRTIVNPNDIDLSSNVEDMSIGRRVAVGLAALQEANREGETIPKSIMDALRQELEPKKPLSVPEQLKEAGLRNPVPKKAFVTTDLYVGGDHFVKANGTIIGRIVKQGKRWRAIGVNSPDFQIMNGNTLKEVTQVIAEAVREGRVYF